MAAGTLSIGGSSLAIGIFILHEHLWSIIWSSDTPVLFIFLHLFDCTTQTRIGVCLRTIEPFYVSFHILILYNDR